MKFLSFSSHLSDISGRVAASYIYEFLSLIFPFWLRTTCDLILPSIKNDPPLFEDTNLIPSNARECFQRLNSKVVDEIANPRRSILPVRLDRFIYVYVYAAMFVYIYPFTRFSFLHGIWTTMQSVCTLRTGARRSTEFVRANDPP